MRGPHGYLLLTLVGSSLLEIIGDHDFNDFYQNNDTISIEDQEAVLESVKALVEAGADINYYPPDASPMDVPAYYLRINGFTMAADYLSKLPQAKYN